MAPYAPTPSRRGLVVSNPVRTGLDAQQTRRPPRTRPLMRKYEVVWLSDTGLIEDFHRLGPAVPCFEAAFAAFGRGTLIQTVDGPRAVEDLLPGDMIAGVHHGAQPLRWMGQMTMVPNLPEHEQGQNALTRISADSFGLGRPMPDLLLGPAARLEHRIPEGLSHLGADRAFVPASAFIDGSSVIEISPVAPVQVYHLSLDRHDAILANGLATEAFHPGRISELRLSDDLFSLYLSMFPHLSRVSDFGDLALPRISHSDLQRAA